MTNEQIIRNAYEVAEKVDVKGWVECFTPDWTFTDMSIGVTYRGPDGPTGVGKTVEVYAKAFPDMHRELYRFFNVGDVVVVELALQGTHKGPLPTPMGIIPPTGKRMDAPCCDVFRLVNGKIQSFQLLSVGNGDLRPARRALEHPGRESRARNFIEPRRSEPLPRGGRPCRRLP